MAKDWNRAYIDGECPWDKGQAAPPLAAYLSKHSIRGRILVPGCGLGHDVRLLAMQGADVTGLDIAPRAIEMAKSRPEIPQARFQIGDFLQLSLAAAVRYDWVFEHTCLCALEPVQRGEYVEALCRVLRPGGHFLAIFYVNVDSYDGLGPPHPITESEIDVLFGSRFKRVYQSVPTQTYASRPVGSERIVRMQRID